MSPQTSGSSRGPATKARRKDVPTKRPKVVSDADRLKRLFTSLCAQIDGGHFANAIKTCDKILRVSPTDADALQTKLFLLLQTDQYEPALSLIDNSAAGSSSGYTFEKAYSLYRLQHEAEAVAAINAIKAQGGEDVRGVVHLEAQLAYRRGSYQEAFDLYNQLLDSAEPHSEEHSDILTNLEAAQKHLDFINSGFLHALDALPASVTSGLESAPPPQPASSLALRTTITENAVDDGAEKKTKKVRTKRVPAGVIPGVTPPPDPERWLKKSERSTFGQGNRRRKGGGGSGATQGVIDSGAPGATSGKGSNTTGARKQGKKKK